MQNQNIHLHTDLIAGLPFEDFASWEKSFNDVFDLHAPMLQLGFLKLLKGCKITNESGIEVKTNIENMYNTQKYN